MLLLKKNVTSKKKMLLLKKKCYFLKKRVYAMRDYNIYYSNEEALHYNSGNQTKSNREHKLKKLK